MIDEQESNRNDSESANLAPVDGTVDRNGRLHDKKGRFVGEHEGKKEV